MTIRSYPKVNICLKITGFLGNYCEIASRFVLVKGANLYDTIEISHADSFSISGNFDCKMQDNTIFRAKEALKDFLESRVCNSVLGMQFRTCENFRTSTDSSLVESPKISTNTKATPQFLEFASKAKQPSLPLRFCESHNLGENQTKFAESSLDSAISQNPNQNNSVRSTQTRPLRGAKNREQGRSSASADFLLEAESRGSPPKSEKRQLLGTYFKKVGGSGDRGAALLRKEKDGEELKYLKDIIKELEFFHIAVDKKIPAFSGLGGGSSNAASYLTAMNEILELNLEPKDLVQIARRVGADVSFFVLGFSSANVFGVGEGVESFNEKVPELEIFTPHIQCSTKAVYDEFRAMQKRGEAQLFSDKKKLFELDSATLMQKYSIDFLNDLYAPACKIYPQLREFAKDGYFFSGSGSSFFKIKSK